jgi:hypothetical protein
MIKVDFCTMMSEIHKEAQGLTLKNDLAIAGAGRSSSNEASLSAAF